MAISHVNTQTGTQANATAATASKPTGTVSGDLLLAVFTSNSQNCTPPSGWTETTDEAIEVFRCQVFYKVAGGSEPASYTFSVPAAAPLVLSVTALRGVDTADPIDIDMVSATSLTHAEPYSTPTVTGGSVGRLVYIRAVRFSGSTVPTFTASGVTELIDVGVFSGGSVSYGQGVYLATSDYSTSGSQSGLAITTSQSESHNAVATLGIKSSGVPGSMSVALPSMSMDVSGSMAIPADMAVVLPQPVVDVGIFHGAYEGPLDVRVPIAMDFRVASDPLAVLDTLIAPVVDFAGETRRFAENVVRVTPEERWLVITQDGYRLGTREAVRDFRMVFTLPELGPVLFLAVVSALGQTAYGVVVANQPVVAVTRSIGATGSVSVAAYGASVAFGEIPDADLVSATTVANDPTVQVQSLAGGVSAAVQVYGVRTGYVLADPVSSSVVANDATVQAGVRAFAELVSVRARTALSDSGAESASASSVALQATVIVKPVAGLVSVSATAFAAKEDLLKYAASVGNGTDTVFTITHNFGSRDVLIGVYDTTTFEDVQPIAIRATTNTVTATFASAPATNAYRVVVLYSPF
ncbi:hypothetical protein ACFWPU_01025 [Streptomyces sp. NPDC058471]|uniref:hypothetical protein n=1 Tax=Streptomyces sp. NPDC058471 TaxID=3346516 RepID=UPI00364AE911